jgi:hypothetical protein
MLVAVVGAVALGSFVVWAFLGKAPLIRHKKLGPYKLQTLLRTLLLHGDSNGILVIHVRRSTAFVQFRRVLGPGRKRALQAGFPRAPWSEAIFQKVVDDLERRGIPVERRAERGGDVSEFALADFGTDFIAAQEHATVVLGEILGVDPERDCYALLQWLD